MYQVIHLVLIDLCITIQLIIIKLLVLIGFSVMNLQTLKKSEMNKNLKHSHQ